MEEKKRTYTKKTTQGVISKPKKTNVVKKDIKEVKTIEDVKIKKDTLIVEQSSKGQNISTNDYSSFIDFVTKLSDNEKKKLVSLLSGNTNEEKKEVIDEKISLDYEIKLISLYNGTLNLSTQGFGKGLIKTFEKFGDVRTVIYDELRKIVDNNRGLTEDGFYYICDDRVIKKLGLSEVYNNLLNENQIKNILEQDEKGITNLLYNCSLSQLDTVVNLIINNINKGLEYDRNKVSIINNVYKDRTQDEEFSIESKVKEINDYNEIFKKESLNKNKRK
jgi:hypothetical protein